MKTSNQPETGNEVFKIMNELNKRLIETETETDRDRDRDRQTVIFSTFRMAHIYNIQPSHVAYSGRSILLRTLNPHIGFRVLRSNQKLDLYPKKRTKIFQNPDNLTECETSFLSNAS